MTGRIEDVAGILAELAEERQELQARLTAQPIEVDFEALRPGEALLHGFLRLPWAA